MVAVGFSPRDDGRESLRVAERRLNLRAKRALHASLRDARVLRSLPVGSSPRLPSWPRSARQNRLYSGAQKLKRAADAHAKVACLSVIGSLSYPELYLNEHNA